MRRQEQPKVATRLWRTANTASSGDYWLLRGTRSHRFSPLGEGGGIQWRLLVASPQTSIPLPLFQVAGSMVRAGQGRVGSGRPHRFPTRVGFGCWECRGLRRFPTRVGFRCRERRGLRRFPTWVGFGDRAGVETRCFRPGSGSAAGMPPTTPNSVMRRLRQPARAAAAGQQSPTAPVPSCDGFRDARQTKRWLPHSGRQVIYQPRPRT